MPKLEQGLLQVYTGNGKGKTTAAVGQAVRALGAGLAVCFIQFIKGGEESSELAMLRALGATVIRPATASTGLLGAGVSNADINAAHCAWSMAKDAIASNEWNLIVLDEFHAALKYHLVPLEEALQVLQQRPAHLEIITTGRQAPEALCTLANLVTEMTPIKHPLAEGIAARRGIEY